MKSKPESAISLVAMEAIGNISKKAFKGLHAANEGDEVCALATALITIITGHLCGYLNHKQNIPPEYCAKYVDKIFGVIMAAIYETIKERTAFESDNDYEIG